MGHSGCPIRSWNTHPALGARKLKCGDVRTWYSLKIRGCPHLKDLDQLDFLASQLAAINSSVEQGISDLPDHKKLVVKYDDLCHRPKHCFNRITSHLIE
jgi:hypothetical protein